MGAVCCCCRKEGENENPPNGDEKEKEGDALLQENPNQTTKPNSNKSEVETLGQDEKPPENEINIEVEHPRNFRKPSSLNNIEEIKSKEEFLIKIFIETLKITHKFCDDFGNFFKPFVEVIFEKQSRTLNIIDEEKLNQSYSNNNSVQDVNESYNTYLMNKKSEVNSAMNLKDKERLYFFGGGVEFCVNDETKFSSLLFVVKNENSYGHLKILPAVTIGQVRIPISTLYSQRDKSYNGLLRLRLKETTDIGLLKVKINIVGDNNLDNSMSLFQSDGFNLMKVSENENSVDVSFNNQINDIILNDIMMSLGYRDIDNKIIDKYFFTEQTINDKMKQREIADNFVNAFSINPSEMYNCFLDALKNENQILLFEIFNKLNLWSIKKFDYLTEFMKLLSDQETEFFYKIHESFFNAYIIKNFVVIIHEMLKSMKLSRALDTSVSGGIINRFPKDEILIDTLFNIIKRVIDSEKKQSPINEYSLELKEVAMWCLSVFNELLSVSSSKQDEAGKAEYTTMYNNSISIMSQRIVFLRMIECYINDSALISALCRVMRKATQNITYDKSPMIDSSMVLANPRDVTRQFKTLIVQKYDGLFLSSLNVILHKYQHYSELHYNVLIIIFQVLNGLDHKYIIEAASKLGLNDFKENFSIYRGKIKTFSKMLNSLHLNILFVFSEIVKTAFSTNDSNLKISATEVLKNVHQDLRAFYRETKSNKKRVEEFKINKYSELEIHELITRIFCNFTKVYEGQIFIGSDGLIIDDMLEFVIKISNMRKENYLKKILDSSGQKKKTADETKKIFVSIVENTITGIKNIFDRLDTNSLESHSHNFLNVIEQKLQTLENLSEFFNILEATLKENNIISNKLPELVNKIRIKIKFT